MVHGNPCLAVLVPVEEREFCDPEEIELTLRDYIKLFCNLLTKCAESVEDD